MAEKSILLTNDDGIDSPGLWAAAEALSDIGRVTVVAPREQHTGAGRSMPRGSDGAVQLRRVTVKGITHLCYAVGGTPAQAVRHGIFELMERKPDLLVSGINYGENVGTCVSISGTIGAAVEGASLGVPGVAVSLQTDEADNYTHSREVDFSTAGHFTRMFAVLFMNMKLPTGAGSLEAMDHIEDVDVLKVEVPADATPDTPWIMTRVSRQNYYLPVKPARASLDDPAPLTYRIMYDERTLEPDADIYALRVKRWVSVSPLSIDMTSSVDMGDLERRLRGGRGGRGQDQA
jgi:5'-nucleotidase